MWHMSVGKSVSFEHTVERSYCWSDQQHMGRDSHTPEGGREEGKGKEGREAGRQEGRKEAEDSFTHLKVRNLAGILVLCCLVKN